MLKHVPFALVLALCTGTTVAQTLTDALSIHTVGYSETRTYYNASSAAGWALTGTGNTWNAASASPLPITATTTYRAPGDSPFASTYPSTTLCAERVQDGTTEWRHYVVDAAHAEMIGVSAEAVVGGRTYCNFPFEMGDSFTDSWTLNGNDFSDTYVYVASGEVQAPWGIIPEVVMFETSGGFSYYLYLASDLLDPIGTYTPGFGLDLWKVDQTTGMADATALHVGLWPNPASDELVLSLPQQAGFTYSLMDARGQVVCSVSSTGDRTVLDLRSYAPGLYKALVTDARGLRASGTVLVVR